MELINISPYIKEYVFAETQFSIIYDDLLKQVEFHGPYKVISYYVILSERAIRKLFSERSTLVDGRYNIELTFGPLRNSLKDIINSCIIN